MVETGGLENRFALTGNGGSNPSPSATYSSIKSKSPKNTAPKSEDLFTQPFHRSARTRSASEDRTRPESSVDFRLTSQVAINIVNPFSKLVSSGCMGQDCGAFVVITCFRGEAGLVSLFLGGICCYEKFPYSLSACFSQLRSFLHKEQPVASPAQ